MLEIPHQLIWVSLTRYRLIYKVNMSANQLRPFFSRIKEYKVLCVCANRLSCVWLCDTMVYSPPGSSVHRILQERTLEWVAMPSPWDLPDPGIRLASPALQADSLPNSNVQTGLKSDILMNTVIQGCTAPPTTDFICARGKPLDLRKHKSSMKSSILQTTMHTKEMENCWWKF